MNVNTLKFQYIFKTISFASQYEYVEIKMKDFFVM